MDHETGWKRGPVPDGLHPQNRSQTVPGSGRIGTATNLEPLHGPDMSEGGTDEGAYGIST